MSECSMVDPSLLKPSVEALHAEQQLAVLAKALSHPARVRILSILCKLDCLGGCLNSDLVAELGLAQSTVSEHLRILKQAELITAEPKLPRMCYKVNKTQLEHFRVLFSQILYRP